MNRKSKITTLLAGVIGLVFSMYGSGAFAAIAGSVHDFSDGLDHDGTAMAAEGTWNPNGEICAVCHTPHGGSAVTDEYLWSRDYSATTFTTYTSSTLVGTAADPTAAGGVSKLCLSCHDGTVALGAFKGGVSAAERVADYGGGFANVGTVLSDDHPISIPLPAAGGAWKAPGSAKVYGGKVECASCHDVHDSTPAVDKLLRVSNASSTLCLDCHVK